MKTANGCDFCRTYLVFEPFLRDQIEVVFMPGWNYIIKISDLGSIRSVIPVKWTYCPRCGKLLEVESN